MTFLQLKNVVNALQDDMDENMFYNLYHQLHHTSCITPVMLTQMTLSILLRNG